MLYTMLYSIKMRSIITVIISAGALVSGALVSVALVSVACAGTSSLRTEYVQHRETLEGSGDLILYSALEEDIELKIAILDMAGDGFKLLYPATRHNKGHCTDDFH